MEIFGHYKTHGNLIIQAPGSFDALLRFKQNVVSTWFLPWRTVGATFAHV